MEFKFSFQILIVWFYVAFIAKYNNGVTKIPNEEKTINGETYPPTLYMRDPKIGPANMPNPLNDSLIETFI